jgi:hypothetical protein
MMERDILSALNSVATTESYSIQLEFLEMVKFFGLGYKELLEEEKVSKTCRKLTASPDTHVKLKAIDVMEKFKFKQADSTDNIQSLITSFDPDGNPLTKMKILDKISSDLRRDDDYEKVVIEKTTILQLLARCLNDVSTVIRDKADEIILGLKSASRKQLADAGILNVWKTMILNRKLQQEYQDTTLARLVPYFSEVPKDVEGAGLIPVVASIIGDSSFSDKSRLLAVNVVEKLNDELFFPNIIEPGTFAKMLEWANGVWTDISEQFSLLGRCLMWGKRCLEIEQKSGPSTKEVNNEDPTAATVECDLELLLSAPFGGSKTDQRVNDYAALLLPVARKAQKLCNQAPSLTGPFLPGFISMLSLFKDCRAMVANLILIIQVSINEYSATHTNAVTFKELDAATLFTELLSMYGANAQMTNHIIGTLAEQVQQVSHLGSISDILGEANCIRLLQLTLPSQASLEAASEQVSSMKQLSWILLWKVLLQEIKFANVFLDLNGLEALSGILRNTGLGAQVRTPAGDVLAMILKNDDILQRVLPDKGLFKSLVDYLDLVAPLSASPTMRLIRQLMVDDDNMAYFCRDISAVNKTLIKTSGVQWDYGEAARELRNTSLSVVAYWSIKGTNINAYRETTEFGAYFSQLLDFQTNEPENFDVACAIVDRLWAEPFPSRESHWNSYFGYRYENVSNTVAAPNRPPSLGWLLLSRTALTITKTTHRPGQSGTVNHYSNALQNLVPSLPKVNLVEACKKRSELKRSKIANLTQSTLAALNSDATEPKKKDKGKEKEDAEDTKEAEVKADQEPTVELAIQAEPATTAEATPTIPLTKKSVSFEKAPDSPTRIEPDSSSSLLFEAPRMVKEEKKERQLRRKRLPQRAESWSSSSSGTASETASEDSEISLNVSNSIVFQPPPPPPPPAPYRRRSSSASSSVSHSDDDLQALLRQLDETDGIHAYPSSSSLDSLLSKGFKALSSPLTAKVAAAVTVTSPKRFLDVLSEQIHEGVWPGGLVEPELFRMYPMMTVGEYIEEAVFVCVDTLAEINYKTMSSYAYSSVLTWLTRCESLHTSGEFEPSPRIKSALCSLIGALYPTMSQRDRTNLGALAGSICSDVLEHSDDPVELVAAVKTAGVLMESKMVEAFIAKPLFDEILTSSFAAATETPENAEALCSFISALSTLAPAKMTKYSAKAAKMVLSTFPTSSKAVTAAVSLLDVSQAAVASELQEPEFLKLLLGILAKNSGVSALDKLGLTVLRGFAGSSSAVASLDDDLYSDLLRGLWRRIAPGGSSEVMREASALIVRLVSSNRDRSVPILRAFDFWKDLSALYGGAQHIYLIPVVGAVSRASSEFASGFLTTLIDKVSTIPANEMPLLYRVLVVLFGAMKEDDRPSSETIGKMISHVSAAIATQNLAIGTALDVMELANFVAREGNHKDNTAPWGVIQAKLTQVMATWNFHQYSFYFTLFQQKIAPTTMIPNWKNPRTQNHIEECTRHILMDRDCLTFGCNQPTLESVIGNTPSTTGLIYFSVSTRILPSWCTMQVGFATKKAWKKFDPENFVGCGNVEGSYGYDPLNLRIYDNGATTSTPNAAKFYQGHVVWCFLHVGMKTISFKTPTSDHPHCIRNVDLSEPLFPCVSVDSDANCMLKFDVGPMNYGPENFVYLPIQ